MHFEGLSDPNVGDEIIRIADAIRVRAMSTGIPSPTNSQERNKDNSGEKPSGLQNKKDGRNSLDFGR